LGVLKASKGRGPGSGVPLTPKNIATVVISLLATPSLSKVDQHVIDLCNAQPKDTWRRGGPHAHWIKLGKPTFVSEVGRVLSGQNTIWRSYSKTFRGIRVTSPWRGQIVDSPTGANPITYCTADSYVRSPNSITVTAEIEEETLWHLILFTKGALSRLEETDGGDE
jgi:hypothetical protein